MFTFKEPFALLQILLVLLGNVLISRKNYKVDDGLLISALKISFHWPDPLQLQRQSKRKTNFWDDDTWTSWWAYRIRRFFSLSDSQRRRNLFKLSCHFVLKRRRPLHCKNNITGCHSMVCIIWYSVILIPKELSGSVFLLCHIKREAKNLLKMAFACMCYFWKFPHENII